MNVNDGIIIPAGCEVLGEGDRRLDNGNVLSSARHSKFFRYDHLFLICSPGNMNQPPRNYGINPILYIIKGVVCPYMASGVAGPGIIIIHPDFGDSAG
jgi:hypothetical protein